MTKKLANTHGRRWSIFSRWDIPDLFEPEHTYLTRFRIIDLPWFGLYLHIIRRCDMGRDLHDHPWGFVTLILSGGYTERWAPDGMYAVRAARDLVPTDQRHWRRGSVHRIRYGEFHSISHLDRQVWSLVFRGPRRSSWTFATSRGLVDNDEYARQVWAKAAHPAGGR